MQGASVDPSGRLRVVDQTPSTGYQNRANEGFTFEPDGRLNVGSAFSVTVANAGLQVSNQGRMKFSPAPVSAAFYNKGWPLNVDGSTLMYINQPVPHDTPFNAGIAMDDRGVYATTTPAPPAPTTRFDLTQFPLDPRINNTRNSVGTYWGEYGTLLTAAINEPRPYRNPTGGPILGLMIEETATNTVRNSVAAGAVVGTPGVQPTNWIIPNPGAGLTRSIVGTGVEKGIEYVDIRYSGVSNAVFINIYGDQTNNTPAINGETFSSSFFWKLVAGSFDNITCRQSVFDAALAYLAEAGNSATLSPSNEISRISCTGTIANAATAYLNGYVQIRFPNGVPVDFTIRIGLPQTEKKAFVTSPIKTTNAPVTRQFDKAIIDPTSWWNPVEGTLACKATIGYSPRIAGISNLMWSADQVGGAFGAGCYGTFQSNTGIGLAPGAAPVNMTSTVNDGVSTYAILAVGLKGNDSIAAVNGVLGAADLACAMPIGVNQLAIGQVGWGTLAGNSCINGYIAYIDYWNTRLPNNQFQELSQWGYQGAS